MRWASCRLHFRKTFLRVLQEHKFRPVGSGREVNSDFRLIAATNRNLDQMVGISQFRSDLLFRLRSFAIELPPLRERPEDVKDLCRFYVDRFCERYGLAPKGFSPDFLEALTAYHWPGNVRELANTIERALASARFEPILFSKHLPTGIRVELARASMEKREDTARFPGQGRAAGNADPARFPRIRLCPCREAIPQRTDGPLGRQHQGSLPHLGAVPVPDLRSPRKTRYIKTLNDAWT